MRDVLVVGSLNVDISLRTARIPRPGETVQAGDLRIGAGGKGLNQALAAARLGARVHMIGRVGGDGFADIPRIALEQSGIDASHVEEIPELHTGIALIVVEEAGQNAITIAGGANDELTPEALQDALAVFRASGVLLVQLEVPLETIEAALDLAKENALLTVLDPAPARELPDELLRKVDVLTPNESEAELLTGIEIRDVESAAEAGKRLQERTLGDVLITLGARGCVWVWSTGFEHVPAPRVNPIDTTAAGDAFNGGLSVGLARGGSVGACIRSAVRAATASTLLPGAAESLPTPEQIIELLG